MKIGNLVIGKKSTKIVLPEYRNDGQVDNDNVISLKEIIEFLNK